MIQIDMQMPANCLECPACNEYLTCAIPINGRKWGENDVREFGQGRPKWCPMKEQEAVEPSWQNGKMYCGHCGSKFPPRVGMRFCHRCGMPIKLKVNDIVEQEGR